LYLFHPLQLLLHFHQFLLSGNIPHPFATAVGHSLVEQPVEVEVVLGQEIHGARVEGELHHLLLLRQRKNVEIEGLNNDATSHQVYRF
jgi:hypothetical protein